MNSSKKNILRKFFLVICIFGALILTINCIREYILDQDVTHIEYKKFHEESDRIYPSITLCFTKPFVENKLKQIEITIDTYTDFLSGENHNNTSWNSSLLDIDYDNVSIHLMDHLHNIKFNLLNNDNLIWNGNRLSLIHI